MPATATPPPFDALILGGGFSGCAVAWQLLRRAPAGWRIGLVEPGEALGRGLAYATPSDSHLLNVPAGRMGLDPDAEGDFLSWLAAQGPGVASGDFVPRRWLGAYVAARLAEAQATSAARLETWRDRAIGARPGAGVWQVETAAGRTLSARQLVLATGFLPSRAPLLSGGAWGEPGLVLDPWSPAATAGLPADAPLLLLGSGLTAVDLFMQLRDAGHRGPLHLLSRHGLLPQAHRAHETRPPLTEPVLSLVPAGQALRARLRQLRAAVTQAAAQGHDWRDLIASLRPITPALWRDLGARGQRQFMRHLQSYWDVHRHRFAPPVAARLHTELARATVRVHAGRLVAIEREADGLFVSWRPRHAEALERLRVARLINCTGPSLDLARSQDTLLRGLVESGRLVPDAQGLGAAVAAGLPPLHLVGPMLKAGHWEATAVPELREHARDAARAVLS